MEELLKIGAAGGVEAEKEVAGRIRGEGGGQDDVPPAADAFAEDHAAGVDVSGRAHRVQRWAVDAILAIVLHLDANTHTHNYNQHLVWIRN